ncbi:nuclear fragile X mental retardation-interacting protein 1-domain-containing protein [Pisolithus marmoratus]|nr:nuclear fragile X mental retardation-interacting protein 1-domain-containing protein [Pisolithus marmoratus]
MQPPPQNPSTSWSTSGRPPVFNTGAVTAALTNPYAQSYVPYGMSQHYYNAYIQASYNRSRPATTADGYTFSSTYTPRQNWAPENKPLPSPSTDHTHPLPPAGKRAVTNPLKYGSWYQPGNSRCQRQGCPFTGSHKSVEIHMMDRHFIFPSGWEKNKKDDWDADPSLKGKPIPIQGTSVLLDTPEAVDAWIAERRKRFPTSERVEEKKHKIEEAIARGQLTPEDMGMGRRKRRRHGHPTDGPSADRGKRFGRCDHRTLLLHSPVAPDGLLRQIHVNTDTDSGEEPPEETTSRAHPDCGPNPTFNRREVSSLAPAKPLRPAPQPKKPLRTPFMSRPELLRNLLLPEIRITVSNLSQAIRFLVDNDFLHGVEPSPGEGQEKMIEILK